MSRSIPHLGVRLGAVILINLLAASSLAAQGASDDVTAPQEFVVHTGAGDTRYASPPLRMTGMVLTLLGVTGAVAGGASMIAGGVASANCDYSLHDSCGTGGLIGGAYTLIGSGVVLAIGIPLWVVGARRVERSGVALLLPSTLSVGPGSTSARWEF
jgi:hypothetical protein